MSHSRFDKDKLVQIPAGALAALHRIAETFVDGMGGEGEEVVRDAMKEAENCCVAQGLTLDQTLPPEYWDMEDAA